MLSLGQGAFNRRSQVWVQIVDLCVSVAGLLLEEAGGAYKDIDEVIQAAENAGLCQRVVRLSPIGNVKG